MMNMMQYIANHPDEFVLPGSMWTFALLSFWTTFMIECACITKMCS